MLLTIPLNTLISHPGNANIMPGARFRKLRAHIERTGKYPPIIVRPIPRGGGAVEPSYQILDGHHRVRALSEIGETTARCDVWDVDDREATVLLLTLNRLEGSDDPRRRAFLIEELRARDEAALHIDQIAKLLPEDAAALERLLALARPPALTDQRANPESDIEPVTFFFTAEQRRRLLARLREVCADRTKALLRLLGLESNETAGTGTRESAPSRGGGT